MRATAVAIRAHRWCNSASAGRLSSAHLDALTRDTVLPPIDIRLFIAAPPERVWSCWTDNEELTNWFPDRVEGSCAPGGRVVYHWDALAAQLAFDVRRADPPERLELVAAPPGQPVQTQRVDLRASAGGTALRLVHAGLTDPDVRDGTAAGWQVSLQLCKLYAERHTGRRRIGGWILGLATADLPAIHARYTAPEGLATWLGTGEIGDAGTLASVALHGGGRLTGPVLVRVPNRDVCVRWDEFGGAVAFRAFRVAPRAALVGVQFASWERSEADVAPVARQLAHAVDRLVASFGGPGDA